MVLYKIFDFYDYFYDVVLVLIVYWVFSGCMKIKNGFLVVYD